MRSTQVKPNRDKNNHHKITRIKEKTREVTVVSSLTKYLRNCLSLSRHRFRSHLPP